MLPKGIRVNGVKYRWELCVEGKRKSGSCNTVEEAVRHREEAYKALQLDTSKAVIEAYRPTLPPTKNNKVPTITEAIEAMKKADWSDAKSRDTIDINCNLVEQFFKPDTRLDQITVEYVDLFVEWLRAKGNKSPSINRKLSIVSKLLTRANEKGQLDKKIYIERLPESPGRVRYITTEEEKKILDLLLEWHEERFYHVVIVLIDTGMRCGELCKLTPYDIQEEQGVHGIVYLNDTKNGENRGVPLTERAFNSLKYLAQTSTDHELLIYEYSTWITKTWNRVRKAMKKQKDPNFVPHILRHTCCSRLVQKGAPLKKVQLWMGHKTINTTMRYAHLAPQDLYDMPTLLEG